MNLKEEIDLLVRQNEALVHTLTNVGVRLESSIKMLSAISRLTSVPIKCRSLDEAASEILDVLIRELTDVLGCSILSYDHDADLLRLLTAKGQADVFEELNGPYNRDLSFKPGEGVAGRVFQENRPVFWDDQSPDASSLKRDPSLTTPPSLACLPLSFQEERIGVLNISFGTPRPFSHPRRRDLILLSEVVSNIIHTFNLKDELDRKAAGLDAARRELEKRFEARTVELSATSAKLAHERTERERTVETLEQSEERFRLIVTNTPDIAFYMDPDLRYSWVVNPPAPLTETDLLGKTDQDLFPENQAFHLTKVKRRALETGGGVRTIVGLTLGGDEKFFDMSFVPRRDRSGRIIGLAGFARDITEGRRAKLELTRLAAAIEQAMESIIILDAEGRKVQYVNPAFEKLTGYAKEEALGLDWDFMENGRSDPRLLAGVRQALEDQQAWTGRMIYRKKDRTHYEVMETLSPVRDPGGRLINWVSVSRDVTHETILENQLRQAQKMEAIGTLAAGIAHDFNNILSAIMGYTELSLSRCRIEDQKVRKNLEQILKASGRAKDLVNQILAFSRQNKPELKPTYVGPILSEALLLLRASLPATIEIQKDLEQETSVVMADQTQVHQVLMNLCTNAANAMDSGGGVLSISLREVRLEASSAELNLPAGDYLRLSVADTGRGMTRKTMERIFDPFFSSDPKGTGAGMGLAVVHGIVKSHGGGMEVESEVGKGSVFKVYLPLVSADDPVEDLAQVEIPGGTESILVVDDEPEVADVCRQMLEDLGYQVAAVGSSPEALDLVRNNPARFDLILTDQTMPKMTGLQLAEELKVFCPKVPVVLYTGYSRNVTPETMSRAGCRALLTKPLSSASLGRTIREVLDEEFFKKT